jgi:uncharacterized membrane protein
MRTDEQRDECIDLLLRRINDLENEVARLNGEPSLERRTIVQQKVQPSNPHVSSAPKQKATKVSGPSDSSLESAIGTRWIGRIGILAIIFGVAFFLKYSFDNKLIGETGRVILGIFWGAVFIGAGEYLQKKRNLSLYGQMVSGGGLAVLYLALYAAFALYHLLPAPLAALCMLVITSTGMTLSIRYSAYSLVAIALLGGFLTPVMLSTGQNQPVILFSYVLLLDMGIIFLLRFRYWPSLVAVSLFGTILLYFGWHLEFFTNDQRWLAFGIVVTFFIFYNLYIFLFHSSLKKKESEIDQTIIFGSAAFVLFAAFAQNDWVSTATMKISTLALAWCEICFAGIMGRRESSARLTIASYAVVSVIMTVIATFVILEQQWIMPALAAEMVALGWIGLRLNYPIVRTGAYLIGIIVLIKYSQDIILYLEPFERFIPILNGRFLVCAAAIGGFYVLLNFMSRYRDRLGINVQHMLTVVFVISQILSLILLSFETHDFFRFRSTHHHLYWGSFHYAYQLSLSVLWGLYASLLIGVGIYKQIPAARIFGIVLLGATVLKVFFVDLSSLQTFYRIISFIVLGLLLLTVSYGYNRFKHIIFGENR